MTREHATGARDPDVNQRIYDAFHGAALRFGESRIKCRRMSKGRAIYYPARWDESERRSGQQERERRLREIERSL